MGTDARGRAADAARPSRRPAGDAGQVATGLIVLTALGALFVLVQVLLPLAGATDQRSRAQTAADAAALAAAQERARGVREALERPLGFVADTVDLSGGCRQGADAAVEYAARNEAEVTAYQQSACGLGTPRSTVLVSVQMLEPLPSGQRSQARAAARLDFPLGRCRLSPTPDEVLEQLTPTEPPDPDSPPGLPADPVSLPTEPVEVRAACGPVDLELELSLADMSLTFRRVLGRDLDDLLEPHLVSTRRLDV